MTSRHFRTSTRAWLTGIGLAWLCMAGIASAAGPEEVSQQIEASMLLAGTIEIEADGSVRGYSIDNEGKVPDYVLENLAKWVPGWRFKPVLVDGKAVPARARMSLRMLARSSGEDKFEISIAATSFGDDDSRPTDKVRSRRMGPPRYPEDLIRKGVQGTALLVLRVGRQGKVEEAVVERVNLRVSASEEQMESFRERLAAAAAEAARRWTFVPPSTGALAQQSSWSVRVPIDFNLGRTVAYGRWASYLPGPYHRAPWLEDDEVGSDALAGGAMHTLGAGPVLLTPPQG